MLKIIKDIRLYHRHAGAFGLAAKRAPDEEQNQTIYRFLKYYLLDYVKIHEICVSRKLYVMLEVVSF